MDIKTTVDTLLEVDAQGAPVGRSDRRINSTATVYCNHVSQRQLQVRCTAAVPPTTEQGIEVHITGLPSVTPTTIRHLVRAIVQLAQKLAHGEEGPLLEKMGHNPKFDQQVSTLDLSRYTNGRLKNWGIRYIGELVQLTEDKLRRGPADQRTLMRNTFGDKSVSDTKAALAKIGLSLNMHVCDWVPPDQRPATPPTP